VPKDSHVTMSGRIVTVHPGGQFKVEIDTTHGTTFVTAKLCGRMRKHRIRVILGDKVDVGLSPYDMSHGIITFRHK
jgi:translation initiation factor IF-1